MTAAALIGPHIQAKGYTRGRAFRESTEVDWLGIHSAEGAKFSNDLGAFFAGTTGGSSNAGIGQDGKYCSYVNYDDTPWTNPPLNQESDTLEICGFASWTRAEWLVHPTMLEAVAQWIAWRATVRKIPIRHVVLPKPGTSGVSGHKDINDVYHSSSHWDPGPNFPWDVVIGRAQAITNTVATKAPQIASNVKEGSTYKVVSGDTYWKLAQGAYKNGDLWPLIARANGNRTLTPGVAITIPKRISGVVIPKPVATPIAKPRIDLPAWPGYGYIAYGKHNGYLKQMQSKLRSIGFAKYLPSGADGIYGQESIKAIKAFQATKKLKQDGIVGPATWTALDAAV